MGWLLRERRGAPWKQGWTEHTLSSLSPPPFPLLAISSIVFLLLYVSSYVSYKNQMQNTVINFKLFLLFLPVLLIFLAVFISKCENFMFPPTKAQYASRMYARSWDLPWGVAVLVVLLLVMISYQSTLKSMWSPIVWRSD